MSNLIPTTITGYLDREYKGKSLAFEMKLQDTQISISLLDTESNFPTLTLKSDSSFISFWAGAVTPSKALELRNQMNNLLRDSLTALAESATILARKYHDPIK